MPEKACSFCFQFLPFCGLILQNLNSSEKHLSVDRGTSRGADSVRGSIEDLMEDLFILEDECI